MQTAVAPACTQLEPVRNLGPTPRKLPAKCYMHEETLHTENNLCKHPRYLCPNIHHRELPVQFKVKNLTELHRQSPRPLHYIFKI